MIPVREQVTDPQVEEYQGYIVEALARHGLERPVAQRLLAESQFWRGVLNSPSYYMNMYSVAEAAQRVITETAQRVNPE